MPSQPQMTRTVPHFEPNVSKEKNIYQHIKIFSGRRCYIPIEFEYIHYECKYVSVHVYTDISITVLKDKYLLFLL